MTVDCKVFKENTILVTSPIVPRKPCLVSGMEFTRKEVIVSRKEVSLYSKELYFSSKTKK